MSEAARSRRDDPRHEPQLATLGRDGSADPLAELARLVGQEDPFRSVFRPAPPPEGARGSRDAAHQPEPYHAVAAHDAHHGHPDDVVHGYDDHAYDEHPDEAQDHAYRGEEAYDDRYADDRYAAAQDAHPDEAGIADGHFAADDAAAATLPDLWARGGDEAPGTAPPIDHDPTFPAAGADRPSSARRPLAVLAAVLLLTGGGLAASFLAKSPATPGTASVGAGRSAPTIMAATGPTKVKVEDSSTTAPEDQDAALLSKNGNVSSGPVKIVSSQEQPADLSLLPKTSDLAEGARPLPPAAPSPFPEPKKVKTFVVHPDGSMLSGDARMTAPDAGASAAAAPASADEVGAAMAATPRTAARGGTTPKSAPPPATIASLAAEPVPVPAEAAAPPRQAPSPGVRTAAAKPNDIADAPSGGYGLQLASSPAEADAQAAFAKLKKKYPALLGSLAATIHKAETGDKPVYRVRVGGMSQDEAKALCSKLQGAGGSCFVVHN